MHAHKVRVRANGIFLCTGTIEMYLVSNSVRVMYSFDHNSQFFVVATCVRVISILCAKTLTEDHATITDTKMRINRKVPTLDAQFVVFHRYVFCTHYHDQWDRHHPYKIHLQSQSACLPAFLPALLCNMDAACVCI